MPSFLSFSTFVTLSLLCHGALAAIGPVTDLVIASSTVSPDGVERQAITAGGSVIGALITGNKGDNFQINVVNNLNDSSMLQSTTIHWHGFFQKGTNWADGPAFVNQCPIAKGDSFLYDFTAEGQAGTFWYHSHLSTQYCDGLRGPIVVYDPSDPYLSDYDVDDDSTVITLADWYHTPAKQLLFPTPDAILINGLGRAASGGAATDLAVISVEQGKKYRMRLVNIACDPNFVFSIDNHTMTVIEVDSVNHQQYEVDSLQIFAGQRFSFILDASQDVGNYWIRANPSIGVTGFDGGINSAILRYVGAADEEPTTTSSTSNALVEENLVPLESPGAPGTAGVGNADVNINLALAFTSSLQFTVNGATFTPPTVPVLLQILSGAQTADNLLPNGSVYSLPPNKVIELSIPGGAVGGPHPFHLHGHTFDVIRSAGSSTYNYDNPPRRDVVSIGAAGDNVTIRWTTDNPGPWFLHCHIDWHLEAGLAIVFAEDTDDWASDIVPTDQWNNLCPIYNALDPSDL